MLVPESGYGPIRSLWGAPTVCSQYVAVNGHLMRPLSDIRTGISRLCLCSDEWCKPLCRPVGSPFTPLCNRSLARIAWAPRFATRET
jgi:hypothetical protein